MGQFLDNWASKFGSLEPHLIHAAKQIGAQVTGGDPNLTTDPATGMTAQNQAELEAPLNRTGGGILGALTGPAALMAIPGVNTIGGGTALGAALGAFQPTQPGESRLLNTGLGATLGGGSQALGAGLGRWATNRAAQPFLGWNQSTGNRAAAQAVGSSSARLDQPAIAEASERLGNIFDAARSPQVIVPIGTPTASMIAQTANGLEGASRRAFNRNGSVQNLTDYLRVNQRSATAQQLGSVSTRLGQQANSLMTSQGGDRDLGRALFTVKDHVDDLIGNSIPDATLQADYAAARPQYRMLTTLTNRPQLLNSVTGDVNLQNFGKYLQKSDKAGYTRGGNQTPIYNAARYGQETGEGKGAPPFSLAENLGSSWLAYHAANNPLARALAGTTSRAIAPASSELGRLAQALALSQKSRIQDPAQRLVSPEQGQ